jgi:hypothetical protein
MMAFAAKYAKWPVNPDTGKRSLFGSASDAACTSIWQGRTRSAPHCLLIVYRYTLAASSSLAWPLPPAILLPRLTRRVLLYATRSAPLYSKKLEGSVVKCVIRCLTTDTRPTGFIAFSSY